MSQVDQTPVQVRSSRTTEVISLAKSLVILIILAIFLRGSVVEAFKIPSSSMEPTLQIGDQILVNKLSYGFRLPFVAESLVLWKTPQRGDIVVFTLAHDAQTSDDTNLIKRIIGLPGDRIEVKGTEVYINGSLLADDSKYAHWLQGGVKDFPLSTVPEGKVFLMGDNRDYSRDARFWSDHFLPLSRIKGRAMIIYWNWQIFDRMFTVVR